MFSRYYGVLLIKFREAFAYRFNYFVKIASNFISLLIIWFIWKAIFAASTGVMAGFTFDSMMIYMSLIIVLNWLFSSFEEHTMEFEVRSGAIAMYLIKPISYPITCFFRGIGSRISTLILQISPFLLTAIFLVKLTWPVSWWFFPSVLL
ncbi:MAG: ABC-2 family transporter protein, partial [Nanoarchaeota archaeon]|nr:ABC-2 family transporter protein [Nanoarchaeota archaeon]